MRILALAVLATSIAACGGDPPSDGFVPCGGDVVAGWDLTALRAIAGGDGCPETPNPTGFIFFQPNGRYSLSMDTGAWMKSPGAGCGFMTAYGGFYRVEGRKICFGDSSAEGSAIPCEGTPPTTQHGVAEFCVEGSRLTLRSDNLLGLTFLEEMQFSRRP